MSVLNLKKWITEKEEFWAQQIIENIFSLSLRIPLRLYNNQNADKVWEEKFTDFKDKIDTLILGCTHYPIIKNQIIKFFNFNIDVIDSGRIVAEFVKCLLTEKTLLNTGKSQKDQFYISDFTLFFEKIAKMFFEETIDLKKIDFWN